MEVIYVSITQSLLCKRITWGSCFTADSVLLGLGWGLRASISKTSQVMLVLLVHGLHLEQYVLCLPASSMFLFSVVQLLSCVQLFITSWTAAHQAPLSSTISQSFLKFLSGDLVMPYSHLILYCPPSPPASIFPSIRIFFSEFAFCNRWPKYWSFSISPSNAYLELIFFRIDFFDLLAVQGTLRSLLQCNSKTSILRCSACFMVQLAHPHMTTGKTVALANTDLCQQSDVSAF